LNSFYAPQDGQGKPASLNRSAIVGDARSAHSRSIPRNANTHGVSQQIQLRAEDVVKDVSSERLGRMARSNAVVAKEMSMPEASRYHTQKSGRAHSRSHLSTNSYKPTTLLNPASSHKIIRDRGTAHERNLSLSQIERYGKRDYSPIITTSKHAMRKIYAPKREHHHSASVQTECRRQAYTGMVIRNEPGFRRSTRSDLHRQLVVKEKQLRLIKDQLG
jgi:hypothetical protein